MRIVAVTGGRLAKQFQASFKLDHHLEDGHVVGLSRVSIIRLQELQDIRTSNAASVAIAPMVPCEKCCNESESLFRTDSMVRPLKIKDKREVCEFVLRSRYNEDNASSP